MKGLLVKDVKIILRQMKTILAMGAIGIFMLISTDDLLFPISYMILILSMFTGNTTSYDAADNGMAYLLTFPINRKLYVREKYVLAICNITIVAAASILSGCIINTAKGNGIPKDIVLYAALGICGAAFLSSVWIPIHLKFGAEKARVIAAACIAVIMISCMGIFSTLQLEAIRQSERSDIILLLIDNIIEHAEKLSSSALYRICTAGLIILSGIFLGISYICSWNVIKKKDY